MSDCMLIRSRGRELRHSHSSGNMSKIGKRLEGGIAPSRRHDDALAGRASRRYETKARSEHSAMRAVIESAECPS